VPDPEEQQHNEMPPLQPQRIRSRATDQTKSFWRVAGLAATGVVIIVGLMLAYVSVYAGIAKFAYQLQACRQQIIQIDRDNIQLKLKKDLLSAQPRLVQMAAAQGLAEPDIKRLHAVSVTSDPQWAILARTTPESHDSWLVGSVHHLVANMDGAVQRFSNGPGVPAYAR